MKKQLMNRLPVNRVFLRTFLMLILASIIPVLVINTMIHRQSISSLEEQIYRTNLNMLTKTGETVDLILQELKQNTEQLAKDDHVVNFIVNPDISFTARNSKIVSTLENMAEANHYIHSVYIYSAYNGTVLSSSEGAVNLYEFSDVDWKTSYDEMEQGTVQLNTRRISDGSEQAHNCMTMIVSLPYESSSRLGTIIVNIDEEKLHQTVSGTDEGALGDVYVINEEGMILSHNDKNMLGSEIGSDADREIKNQQKGFFIERHKGDEWLITYTTSPYNQWKYVYTVHLKSLQSEVAMVSRSIIIITAIYLFLALIIAYFFGHAFTDVVDRNTSMETIIENTKPIIKEKLFVNLISGKKLDVLEIREKLQLLDIQFSQSNFIVIAMQIDEYQEFLKKYDEIERNIYKINLISTIEAIISRPYKGVCVEIESDQVAAIINFSEELTVMQAKEKTLELSKIIKNDVKASFPFTMTFGIGRMYTEIVNMKLSYSEAVNALKYKLYQGKDEIIIIDDIKTEPEELYFYDTEKEKVLINQLKVGQKEEIARLINEVIQEILDHRSRSYTYVRQVFVGIINSVIEVIIGKGLTVEEVFGTEHNLYVELFNKETIDDIKIWLPQVFYTTIDSIDEVNHSKSHVHAENILAYIDEHLCEDISLNVLADMIGFSPAYVSKIIKEHAGVGYIDYLNGSRIEMAKKLLVNTQLTAKEIGFRVGFNNIQTFMRRFKKYEGITPGQYRERA